MAKKKSDHKERLDLVNACPDDLVLVNPNGHGAVMYRNTEIVFTDVPRAVAERVADDPAFKYIQRATKPKKGEKEAPTEKQP